MSGSIRERTAKWEEDYLSPFATASTKSRGRIRAEDDDPVRTCFQRDRDRIIHLCRAFRRLAHKTQVFFSPREDHLRTRLSHTLEVSQIGRTIAKALRLVRPGDRVVLTDAGHGTSMLSKHPELIATLVDWFQRTLV